MVSKVEKNFHALFWIEALQSRRQKPKQKLNMAANANSKKNPKAPLEQQNTIVSLQEKIRYQDEVAREIVVTAPEPPWDLTQSNTQSVSN